MYSLPKRLKTSFTLVMSVHQKRKIKWALDSTKAQLTGKCVHYNKVSLYRGSFPYNLLLLG